MMKRKRLLSKAKHLQTESAWSSHCQLKNAITGEIRTAHSSYQNSLFDNNTDINHKKFWRYTSKASRRVPPLHVDNKIITNNKKKAEALNNQFYSVFTNEDLGNTPEWYGHPYPEMSNISFTSDGIQTLLDYLNTNKATGPDNISAWVLKHCSTDQSYQYYLLSCSLLVKFPMTGWLLMWHLCLRKDLNPTLQTM